MVRRGFFVLGLFVLLFVGVFFEQRFIDTTCAELESQIAVLTQNIKENNLEKSKQSCQELEMFWKDKEAGLSLMVDFKDIEKIGTQITLVSAHLENEDFELAFDEAKVLNHAVEIFYSTVCFDFQNVI